MRKNNIIFLLFHVFYFSKIKPERHDIQLDEILIPFFFHSMVLVRCKSILKSSFSYTQHLHHARLSNGLHSRNFHFQAAGFSIPHPSKRKTGGEDAYMVTEQSVGGTSNITAVSLVVQCRTRI